MTSVRAALTKELAGLVSADVQGAPEADLTVAPATLEEAARLLDLASEHGVSVLVWGAGTHQGYGGRVHADVVLATHRLDRIVDWQPDDMTVTVEAGVRVGDLEERLAERGQTAVLPEDAPEATVGGVVAAGVSGWRRARFGPTRDRMLEVELVTGDGRRVRAGGRVVKNVTGYDLPRLASGSFGSLGLIGRMCLKLWPAGIEQASCLVDSAEAALAIAYRPLAVLEVDGVARCYLAGTGEEVEGQLAALGADPEPGLTWPAALADPVVLVVRVPPSYVRAALDRAPAGWRHQAAFGVGEVRLGAAAFEEAAALELREWAESRGGNLVVARAPDDVYEHFDPWGALPPGTLRLQERIVARFDPVRVVNPGRLPGGI